MHEAVVFVRQSVSQCRKSMCAVGERRNGAKTIIYILKNVMLGLSIFNPLFT